MGSHDHYCIRPDYVPHAVNVTAFGESGAVYWTPRMIRKASYYQYHVYWRARELVLQHSLRSVLDIGCGPAVKLKRLIAPVCGDVVGMDEPGIVEYCKQRYHSGRFISYDIEHDLFPLADTFDLILCADVVEHLVDPDRLLAAIRVASHDETLILLSTPDRDTLRGPGCLHSPKAAHVREWNRGEFRAYLSSRGFEVCQHSLVPPMKFHLSREYFEQWYSQLRAGRRFESCQMAVCRKRPTT